MDLANFLTAASLLSGGTNAGALVPVDDATDALAGARYIAGEVTMARRRGERVVFHPERHVWTMPDGQEVGDTANKDTKAGTTGKSGKHLEAVKG